MATTPVPPKPMILSVSGSMMIQRLLLATLAIVVVASSVATAFIITNNTEELQRRVTIMRPTTRRKSRGRSDNNNKISTAVQETRADLEELAERLNPVVKFWDPLDLVSTSGAFWGFSEERTIGWLRESEVKHGRISMFAVIGYIVQSTGIIRCSYPMTLDGQLFPSSDLSPPEQWDALPLAAKVQILLFIGFLEFFGELNIDGKNAHYTKGGKIGAYPALRGNTPHPVPFNLYDPFSLYTLLTDEQKEGRLRAELNNGRLAMLGIMSFLCEQKIPGSVPALTGLVKPYSGEVMAPFEGHW